MILGTSYPKFEYNSTEVSLGYVNVLKNEPIKKEARLEKEIANEVYIHNYSDRWLFQVSYNIFRHASQVMPKFYELYPYENQEVYLKPHADGNYFKNSSGERVLFKLTLQLTETNTRDFKDTIICTFESLTPIDLQQSALPENVIWNVQTGGIRRPLTDSSGNIQTYEI